MTYKERRRVLRANQRDLAETCAVAFNVLTPFRLEVWNDEWSSWVVFGEGEVPKKPKIRMIDELPSSPFIVLEESTLSAQST